MSALFRAPDGTYRLRKTVAFFERTRYIAVIEQEAMARRPNPNNHSLRAGFDTASPLSSRARGPNPGPPFLC